MKSQIEQDNEWYDYNCDNPDLSEEELRQLELEQNYMRGVRDGRNYEKSQMKKPHSSNLFLIVFAISVFMICATVLLVFIFARVNVEDKVKDIVYTKQQSNTLTTEEIDKMHIDTESDSIVKSNGIASGSDHNVISCNPFESVKVTYSDGGTDEVTLPCAYLDKFPLEERGKVSVPANDFILVSNEQITYFVYNYASKPVDVCDCMISGVRYNFIRDKKGRSIDSVKYLGVNLVTEFNSFGKVPYTIKEAEYNIRQYKTSFGSFSIYTNPASDKVTGILINN